MTPEQQLEADLAAINDKYEELYAAGERRGEEIERRMEVSVEMETKRVVFDVPKINWRVKEISFDVPQVTMRIREIKTELPECRMVIRHIGLGIKTKVPECRNVTRTIAKTKVPDVRMNTVAFKTHLPHSIERDRVEIILDLPKVTGLDYEEARRAGESLEGEMDQAAKNHETEINQRTATYLEAEASELESKAGEAAGQFAMGIEMLTNAIETYRRHKQDAGDLEAQLKQLTAQRDQALSSMHANIKSLRDKVAELLGGDEAP